MTRKIPELKSLEEAAVYWDTHSFAEYIGNTEPVEIEVNLTKRRIMLEIDSDLSEKPMKIGRKKKKL